PDATTRGDTVSGRAVEQSLDNSNAAGAMPARRPGWSHRLVGVGAALLTCGPFLAMLPSASAGASSRPPSMVVVTGAPRIPAGDGALGSVAAGSPETGVVVLRPSDEAGLTSFI